MPDGGTVENWFLLDKKPYCQVSGPTVGTVGVAQQYTLQSGEPVLTLNTEVWHTLTNSGNTGWVNDGTYNVSPTNFSWACPAVGDYYLVCNNYYGSNGQNLKCTGNPFGFDSNWSDCKGYDNYTDAMVVSCSNNPVLTCSLTANPAGGGEAPLTNVDLTGDVGGTATGLITYAFDCDNNGTPEHSSGAIATDPYTVLDLCNYLAAGNYTAKLTVTRGGLTANCSATIPVTSIPLTPTNTPVPPTPTYTPIPATPTYTPVPPTPTYTPTPSPTPYVQGFMRSGTAPINANNFYRYCNASYLDRRGPISTWTYGVTDCVGDTGIAVEPPGTNPTNESGF